MNSTPAAIPVRKVQARFRLKLCRSFFIFKLLNFEFLFNKRIAAFWVGHLPFLQVGFVTVRVLSAWLRLDKVTFYRCKLFLSFTAFSLIRMVVLV